LYFERCGETSALYPVNSPLKGEDVNLAMR
jgi:hypothetical protein